ncbi:NAD-dependent epimerase/dehydratase family protein [Brevibacillus panacihumi]|uniref:SDR family oxidoreductase n=1 Tax=Brevibacillus panacihumi TaxID=497735 RepID=A0A3M8DDR0_9BACL|nr:NAD-dependent epimerase/dehydratase family protein [Brevibacillus panacihumi]RNB86138.1 SDR family oxidoreductase [Brevibacillus panacihumi]
MRVLVTGATGFLGSHLVKALLAEGHEVYILKRKTSDCSRLATVLHEIECFDLEHVEIEGMFRDIGPLDAVIHTATSYARNQESYHATLEANVSMPLQVLEGAIRCGTPLFMNTDTFSNTTQGIFQRLVGYHLTKRHFLEWGKHLAAQSSLRFVNLKLEHLYGPADSPEKFIPYIVRTCLENQPDLYLTPGEQMRDFIHVRDAVDAYLLLLRQSKQFSASFCEFQVGSGVATSIKSLVREVHRLTESATTLHFGALPYPPQEMMHSLADVESLRRYGWRSQVPLREGLLTVIEEHRSRISAK